MELKEAVIDFSSIEYERKLPDRSLYPFTDLNYLTGGMELGEISVVAGETGGGKTTLVSQFVEEIIKDDKMFCIYGESTIEKQQQSTYRQFAGYGKDKYEYVQYYKNGKKTCVASYFVNKQIEKEVKEKTSRKLFYYDTKYGMDIDTIMKVLEFCYSKGEIRYFLIDNIMQIDLSSQNEVKETKDIIERFRMFAIENKVHIIIVCHYRKFLENGQIRRNIQEIAGTSAIGNKCATAINIIRLNNIDRDTKSYKNLFKVCEINGYDIDKADAVLEVLKTRFNKLGFVALKYDKISNTYYEVKKDVKVESSDDEQPKLFVVSKEDEQIVADLFN